MEEVVSKLTKLKALLDAGAISREDFDREKARLLSGGPQRLSALSGPVQRRSFLNARWLWIVIPVAAVLAVALVLLLRSRTSSAPASASAMEDDFTQDQSLSKGLWVTRGAVPGVFNARAGSRLTALSSAGLSFSADKGLEMIGAVGSGQLIGFRSTTSFDVPLSIKADVMPSGSGDFFGLMLADATVTKGLAIGGRLSSADGPGTIEYATPRPGPDWASRGTLLNSPQKNVWYTLSILLSAHGGASLKLQEGTETVGQTSVQVGSGPFYVSLLQVGSGEPASSLGHTHWRSISVLSGGGLAGVAGNSTAVASSHIRLPGMALLTVHDSTITGGQTSLQLPPGRSLYLYGMATGGGAPSSAFAAGDYARASDAAGQLAVALAATPENTDTFTTDTGYYVIGGMGVSRFSRYSASYGSNGSSGAPSASDTFTLSQNSLVVVIALAAGQQSIRLNGIPGLHMDASSSEPEAMVIGHAHLVPGVYTITEHSAALAGGQDPNHMADLVGVFVFQ